MSSSLMLSSVGKGLERGKNEWMSNKEAGHFWDNHQTPSPTAAKVVRVSHHVSHDIGVSPQVWDPVAVSGFPRKAVAPATPNPCSDHYGHYSHVSDCRCQGKPTISHQPHACRLSPLPTAASQFRVGPYLPLMSLCTWSNLIWSIIW